MNSVIVFVNNSASKAHVDIPHEFSRNVEPIEAHAPLIPISDIRNDADEYRNTGEGYGPWKDIEMISCDPADVNRVVDIMSKMWPGKEILVAQVTKVFSRAVGDLIEKTVSESGVLPF